MLCRSRTYSRLTFLRSLRFQFVVTSCYSRNDQPTALHMKSLGSCIHIDVCFLYMSTLLDFNKYFHVRKGSGGGGHFMCAHVYGVALGLSLVCHTCAVAIVLPL